MSDAYILENTGRRSGIERRKFLYTTYFPERRSGKDRRSEVAIRRKHSANRKDVERRSIF